jgi:hypothetical protein
MVLLASVLVTAATHGTGYWQIVTFAVGPDLTLLAGPGQDLRRGQPHPRAVRGYNLAHRLWGPAALIAVSAGLAGQVGWLLGGLAWAFHIVLDRALGFGLRTPAGFQRD